ncbi:hypothetical protein CAPTEDRAFT_185094 [Capitella teleta]|uniref:U2A'/phosphoprotein 32 family A C-terminal domain-containing protein n=1 Tax=Capitella teleta TaxID=283909 RepID=R7U501_CAPTE|nr:hypothetical protein CAPTEDRAFT_185094 [Capitella teleta]|eukprot:ELT98235.1 hypothetical protein CAPTEDRAFT_185094 [Capitella teleta]
MVKLTEALVLARSRASDLEHVRKFNCWGSNLSDISILRQMPNVQIISLSVNKITTLADIAYCPNVEELYIRRNEIPSLSEIHHLSNLPKLRNVWLADNPCADTEKYRLSVLRALPNLQKLDNIAVTTEELNEALESGLDIPKPGKSPPTTFEPRPLPPLPSQLKIRQQLGLKPISIEKVTPMKPRVASSAKSRNANLLQAVLHLVNELDPESLEVVGDAVRNRLEIL